MADQNNGNNFGNVYSDRAQYDAAMAEWQRKKASGDPFPGPMPRLDVPGQIEDKFNQVNFPDQIKNADFWQGIARQGAQAGYRTNPYSTAVADQTRAAQLALINQMRGQMQGPSLAAMQGQRAMAQSGQQALGAAAMGAPGRAAMLNAQQVGGGLAGDVGQARLAEVMRAQAGMGGVAGGLRGGDLRSAGASADAMIAQRRADDAMRQFYAAQGAGLSEAQARADLEKLKLQQRLGIQAKENDLKKLDSGMNIVGSIFGGLLK